MVVRNRRDGFGSLELSWATQPVEQGWVASRTRVVFDDVVEYRWKYFDVDDDQAAEGGLELGELEGSDRLAALAAQGFDRELRHFLISFDEHGIYEVICRSIDIHHQPRRRATPADDTDEGWSDSFYPCSCSCLFDGRALLFTVDSASGRLQLECKGCGRTYDTPADLSRVHPAQPDSASSSRPASLDEIRSAGWARFLPLDDEGHAQPT
ncbi:hypothetical protein [Kribbella flavida]|uniref:hypothetical protein n=1 Tax=Kribbella flavida TaxID=182640 RepID=UPI00019BDE26|nr:hypothetical protein [Kribbella flavida]